MPHMRRNAKNQRWSASKGQIWISAVLYILIAVAIMVLVLQAGIPIIKGLQEKASFTRAKDTMLSIDQQIKDVASEGQGSQRVVPLDVSDGKISVENNALRWKIESDTKLLEPRTKLQQGNLVISSDVDVSAAQIDNYYILQNSKILVNISKYGSESNMTNINTSRLINYVIFKDTNAKTNGTFKLYDAAGQTTGTGYTTLLDPGTGLVSARVLAHVNTTNFDYDAELKLDSNADFITVNFKNIVQK